MRKRKSFERPEGVKSGRLVVIAAEGKETENIYFEQMKASLHASGVQIEVLRRDSNESSPEHVYRQIQDLLQNMIWMKTISYGRLLTKTGGRSKCFPV